jgi:hypothetical protein
MLKRTIAGYDPRFLRDHENAVTSVSNKFFFIIFNAVYIREDRAALAGLNRLSEDAKSMTFVPKQA